MPKNKIKKREDVEEALTWDLSKIFSTEEEFKEKVGEVEKKAGYIREKYQGNLDDPDTIINCLKEYEQLMINGYHLYTYAHLAVSVDQTNSENQERLMKIKMLFSRLL
ncbi:MAG: oligoendopeptidase F, partial [Bacillota bacterium]